MIQKQRYDWADFMRGIMMFLVVLYHSEVYYGSGHTLSWMFEPIFLSGFLFVSGYLFTRDIQKVDIIIKLKQVLRAIVFPYFIFVLILALPKIAIGHAQTHQLIIDIITLRASWFVITIGVLQIIFAAALLIKPSVLSLIVSTIILFIFGYAFVHMYRNCPEWIANNPWLQSKELPNRLPVCINLALAQSPFFAARILFRRYENQIPNIIVASKNSFVCSFLAYILLYIILDHSFLNSTMVVVIDSYNNILLIFIYSILGIWALMCLSRFIQTWKPLNYIGKHSILFYFLNGASLTLVSTIIKRLAIMDPSNYFNQIIVAIIATVFMFPCVWFINRYIPVLVGNKDSFNKISKKFVLKINW